MATSWLLDASVFVNFVLIDQARTLLRARAPLTFPEYVYRIELLGTRAPEKTRSAAHHHVVIDRAIAVEQLTLEDLAQLADRQVPPNIGMGEACCAVLAERLGAGVLCDDRRAKNRLLSMFTIPLWEGTVEILLHAAHTNVLTEYELVDCQAALERNRFTCKTDLREEYLIQRLAAQTAQHEASD